ncbi:MAG: molybdopterin molybdotransferase MoeA [Pseudomonadales bacterium]
MSIPRLDLEQAVSEIRTAIDAVAKTETVKTEDAWNRVLACSVTAPLSLPPFASSAMDGYAYNSALYDQALPLQLVGTALAGHPFSGAVGSQQCVRITTGAMVPEDTDTVVIQEQTMLDDDRLTIAQAPNPGDNIRAIGHDVGSGQPLIEAGVRLNPFMLSWLAACGIDQVQVRRKPTVAIFSSGDELIQPGSPLGPGQIYDSNRLLLRALIRALPVTVLDGGRLADDPQVIRRALADASSADLIITSGGVSVGDADHLTEIVRNDGALNFWQLNVKPGKPLAFGRLGDAWYLGLPGNPVSTAVTFLLLAQPAILALAGAQEEPVVTTTATLTKDIQHKSGREEFQRGYLSSAAGITTVTPTGDQSSNRLASFREANCLIRLQKSWGNAESGRIVEVLPFQGLL